MEGCSSSSRAGAAAGARADSPSPSDHSDAGDELREGIELFRRGEYRRSIEKLSEILDAEVSTAVDALRWSAQANAKLGNHEKAESQLHMALKKADQLMEVEKPRAVAAIQLRLAACEQRKGDDDAAERLQREALANLEEAEKQAGWFDGQRQSRKQTTGSAWNNLGITLMRKGELAEARECFEKALAVREELGDQEGYCLAATNMLVLEQGEDDQNESAESTPVSQDFVTKLEEHLQTARRMGASTHLLRPLRLNTANCLEAAKAWRPAARARRELFGGLAVPDEELRLTAKCPACQATGPRLRCSRCRRVFFCTDVCQRKAWPIHKHECTPRDEAAERAKATQDCPICLDGIYLAASTDKNPVTVLECMHVVHSSCWQNLMEAREGDAQCPVCRDSLPMSGMM
eukprot:TRINITY_DN4851_c1_g2_i1.p1 TRINITY_DN4851_c1_g2~~TRINITY_DN4851_c1_g2_i1.p1  ORF type:complete len:405 (-),score=79.68 TRINITY_DN4851_c1_g2_i1:322-1536(-)